MLIQCPACQTRIRRRRSVAGPLPTLNCPHCGGNLRLDQAGSTGVLALIAHEDQEICRQLADQLEFLPLANRVCREPVEVTRQLNAGTACLLLIDVAFAGGFPFELIELAKQQDGTGHKVVLLPSIYRKTAYKRRPASLYGADRYLELHHIEDCLLPLVVELFPQLQEAYSAGTTPQATGGERALRQNGLSERALELCRLLVADIALYHQDRLAPGMKRQEARQLFDDYLAEGRQLLLQHLPEAAVLQQDYLLQAFDEFYDSYQEHHPGA